MRPSFSLRTLSDDRAMSMVAAGLGVTVAPSSFKRPGLASVTLAGFNLSRDVGLVFSDRMRERGGAFVEAARAMSRLRDDLYTPEPEAVEVYNQLYAEYVALHDYFGRGENNVMKRLKALRRSRH